MKRPHLKFKHKTKRIEKEVMFEPYGPDEFINVPEDRHKLTPKQIAVAKEWFSHVRLCRICGRSFNEKRVGQIDHCHVTGVIRGKLCYRCNVGLGYFRDDVNYIKRAFEYLDYFKYNPDMIEPNMWGHWYGFNDPRNTKGELDDD